MKLRDVFPKSRKGLDLLIAKANAFDDPTRFRAGVRELPVGEKQDVFFTAVKELSRELVLKAQTQRNLVTQNPDSRPVVFSAQQPYVDYTLAVAAKIDALNSLTGGYRVFFGFADYDYFGSDHSISQIKIPTAYPGAKNPLLGIGLYSRFRDHRRKDMRFAPPPDKEALEDSLARIRDSITHSLSFLKQEIPFSARKRALDRLEELRREFEYARLCSRNASEFNTIWSVRVFRRMGYDVLFCELSKLLDHENLADCVADTLGRTIRENRLFVESINEIVMDAGDCDLLFRTQEEGYVPIFMTDKETGTRFPLKLRKAGPDFLLVSAGKNSFRANIASASHEDIREFLLRHKGLWSPNIFLPIYLYRCGLQGIISGKSSIKYSVVLGHVMERLFGEKHPPNLPYAGSVPAKGILHSAVQASRGQLPEPLVRFEPTLFYKMIFADREDVRKEIEGVREQ